MANSDDAVTNKLHAVFFLFLFAMVSDVLDLTFSAFACIYLRDNSPLLGD